MLTFGIIKSMSKLHADWCKTAPTRRLTRLLLTRSPDCGEVDESGEQPLGHLGVGVGGGQHRVLTQHNHHFRHKKAITVDTVSSFKVACYFALL